MYFLIDLVLYRCRYDRKTYTQYYTFGLFYFTKPMGEMFKLSSNLRIRQNGNGYNLKF